MPGFAVEVGIEVKKPALPANDRRIQDIGLCTTSDDRIRIGFPSKLDVLFGLRRFREREVAIMAAAGGNQKQNS